MAKPFIVTSLKVDEDLWKKAKKRAIEEETGELGPTPRGGIDWSSAGIRIRAP
jgi:hypothetical protein